jgi:hypothetical protein
MRMSRSAGAMVLGGDPVKEAAITLHAPSMMAFALRLTAQSGNRWADIDSAGACAAFASPFGRAALAVGELDE